MNKETFYKTLNNIVGKERLTNEETYIINDYVSELELEIERLNENNLHMQEEMARTWEKYDSLKGRVEEALYKIQYIIDYGFDYDGFGSVERLKGLIDMLVDYAREARGILEGEDDEIHTEIHNKE